MRRVAVFLTVLAIIFWFAFGFFARDLSAHHETVRGDVLTLVIFLLLTIGVIWTFYGLGIWFSKRFTSKKPR